MQSVSVSVCVLIISALSLVHPQESTTSQESIDGISTIGESSCHETCAPDQCDGATAEDCIQCSNSTYKKSLISTTSPPTSQQSSQSTISETSQTTSQQLTSDTQQPNTAIPNRNTGSTSTLSATTTTTTTTAATITTATTTPATTTSATTTTTATTTTEQRDNFLCVYNCGDGYFTNDTVRECQPCFESCKTCENSESCTSCKEPLVFLEKGKCVDKQLYVIIGAVGGGLIIIILIIVLSVCCCKKYKKKPRSPSMLPNLKDVDDDDQEPKMVCTNLNCCQDSKRVCRDSTTGELRYTHDPTLPRRPNKPKKERTLESYESVHVQDDTQLAAVGPGDIALTEMHRQSGTDNSAFEEDEELEDYANHAAIAQVLRKNSVPGNEVSRNEPSESDRKDNCGTVYMNQEMINSMGDLSAVGLPQAVNIDVDEPQELYMDMTKSSQKLDNQPQQNDDEEQQIYNNMDPDEQQQIYNNMDPGDMDPEDDDQPIYTNEADVALQVNSLDSETDNIPLPPAPPPPPPLDHKDSEILYENLRKK